MMFHRTFSKNSKFSQKLVYLSEGYIFLAETLYSYSFDISQLP